MLTVVCNEVRKHFTRSDEPSVEVIKRKTSCQERSWESMSLFKNPSEKMKSIKLDVGSNGGGGSPTRAFICGRENQILPSLTWKEREKKKRELFMERLWTAKANGTLHVYTFEITQGSLKNLGQRRKQIIPSGYWHPTAESIIHVRNTSSLSTFNPSLYSALNSS